MEMRPKTYSILDMAVKEGVRLGWNRAHKHLDSSQVASPEAAIETIRDAVMLTIQDYFDFLDEGWTDDCTFEKTKMLRKWEY